MRLDIMRMRPGLIETDCGFNLKNKDVDITGPGPTATPPPRQPLNNLSCPKMCATNVI